MRELQGVRPQTRGSVPAPQSDRGGHLLDLCAIEASLREVEMHFANINLHLKSPREQLDRHTVDHIMSGYAFIDELIDAKIDLFSLGRLRLFLELNALVLCGRDDHERSESARFLAATDKYFFDNVDGGIRDVFEWHALHNNESAWMRAAGVYIRTLSEPELFIEGNHRTGALVMSYILVRGGHPPFVLTVEDAKEFLDWSALFSSKRKTGLLLRFQMPRLKHRFAKYLLGQSDPKFLRSVEVPH
jgi:hypothetical protein